MRKLSKNRRAVSPVIATVLMILITMAGMTLLFAFVSSYSENYKAGIGSSVMESTTVEDIWLSPQSLAYDGKLTISVYNTGKVDTVINSIYVNGSELTFPSSTNYNLNIPVPVGQHLKIPAEWTGTWVSGVDYSFKIVTARGSNFEIDYMAP
jgi:archaeal type IV pilus assembly protein PilA